jgi:sulfur relay (sulfurtransferase) complex TusBCD TusD component (DsrE family)
VKVLVIVNSSPWGGSLGVTALRLVRAMLQPVMLVPDGADALRIAAVYFREEGVYHAVPGRVTDSGTPALRDAWLALATQHGLPLLLCSSAAQRRLEDCPSGGFREAGLAEMLDVMRSCDRVVSF